MQVAWLLVLLDEALARSRMRNLELRRLTPQTGDVIVSPSLLLPLRKSGKSAEEDTSILLVHFIRGGKMFETEDWGAAQ